MTANAMTVNFAGDGPATTEPRQVNRVADPGAWWHPSGEAVSSPTVIGSADTSTSHRPSEASHKASGAPRASVGGSNAEAAPPRVVTPARAVGTGTIASSAYGPGREARHAMPSSDRPV